MTPEPKPPILTASQCEAWLGMDNHRWSIEGSKFTAGVEAIATEKTKVVPVRSEAEERERFEKWKRATWPNAGIMQRKMMHSAWLAATRDA